MIKLTSAADGGKNGGRGVAATTPERVAEIGTHTGVALRPVLGRNG